MSSRPLLRKSTQSLAVGAAVGRSGLRIIFTLTVDYDDISSYIYVIEPDGDAPMTTAAEIACYVQPVTGFCAAAAMAWVDTSKTAVLRRRVTTAAEAAGVIEDARAVAVALGGGMAIKTVVVTAWDADRAPAGVKRLQGTRIVEAAR
jgi:hypothetical protein